MGDSGDSDAGTRCCGQQDVAGSSDPPPDPFLTSRFPSDGPTLLLVFFFLKVFLMWTGFKVFIEFVTTLPLFYVLVFWLRGMWDPRGFPGGSGGKESTTVREMGVRSPC